SACLPPVFPYLSTPTSEIYPLSLHDALPIFSVYQGESVRVRAAGEVAATAGRSRYFVTVDPFSGAPRPPGCQQVTANTSDTTPRSEEHTSELQSREKLVCRLLLEKKKTKQPV